MSDFSNKFKRIPPVTTVLIAANIIIYIALLLAPSGANLFEAGAVSVEAILDGEWWTLVTSMFLHSGIMHIACNMISLYYLGVMCERMFGSIKFLVLYLISGLAGNVAFVAVNYLSGDVFASAVGASGAVFGLFGAYGYVLVRERKRSRILAFPASRADIQSYLTFLVINLIVGFAPGSGIANEAHIGGMVCGFVFGAIMYALTVRKLPPSQGGRGQDQRYSHPRFDDQSTQYDQWGR